MANPNSKRKEELVGTIFAELGKYAAPDTPFTESPLRNLKTRDLEAVKMLMDQLGRNSRGINKPEKERVGKGIFPKRGDYKDRLMAYLSQWEHELPPSYLMPCSVLEVLANYLEAKRE